MTKLSREILWFVSGPLRPIEGETIKQNAIEICKYVRVLEKAGLCVTAPYLGIILGDIFNDRDRVERARGMEIDLQVLSRCDGNILIGSRLSDGMKGEAETSCALNKPVYNLVESNLSEAYENAKLLKKYEHDVMTALNGMFYPNFFRW